MSLYFTRTITIISPISDEDFTTVIENCHTFKVLEKRKLIADNEVIHFDFDKKIIVLDSGCKNTIPSFPVTEINSYILTSRNIEWKSEVWCDSNPNIYHITYYKGMNFIKEEKNEIND